MKTPPSLLLQPENSREIFKRFAQDKPLSCDQINFLDWHQHQLSSTEFDLIYKYYIESVKRKKNKLNLLFLLPEEEITLESIKKLQKRIKAFLQKKPTSGLIVGLTWKQFLKFKKISAEALTFWHGNQSLTGAPRFLGGVSKVIRFQWGNFFGVVKPVVQAEAKSLVANVLLYFEDLQDRSLRQSVADYQTKVAKHINELQVHENPAPALPKFKSIIS